MSSARERAREAARTAYYGHSNFTTTFLDRHADAASDVWEPLLRKYGAHEAVCMAVAAEDGQCDCGFKEALG